MTLYNRKSSANTASHLNSKLRSTMQSESKLRFLSIPAAPYILIWICVLLLSTLGLVMVLSASSITSLETTGDTYSIFLKQCIFAIIGWSTIYLGTRPKTKIWDLLTKFSFPVSVVLLISPLFLGHSINGNHAWINLGSISFQPSEVGKILLILWFAKQLDKFDKNERLSFLPDNLPPVLSLVSVPLIFLFEVLAGKDLGTSGIYFVIILGMLYLSSAPGRFNLTLLTLAIIIGGIFARTNPARWRRFAAVLNPFAAEVYQYAGWQPAHSIMAIASGGIFGIGLGAGKQKWGNLGEAHTDFIFAVIGEELGLLGTLLVLMILSILIYSIFRIAIKCKEPVYRYAAAGVGIWLLIQVIINTSTAVSALPVMGVTLPFVSYGGSSLIANFAGVALVLYIAKRNLEISNSLIEDHKHHPIINIFHKNKSKKRMRRKNKRVKKLAVLNTKRVRP